MAKKSILVSDLTDREIDPEDSVEIVVKHSDRRRGVVLIDARIDDELVQELVKLGRKQQVRGRRPKVEA